MSDITPADVKKQSLAFAKYQYDYLILYLNAPDDKPVKKKTPDELYEDFTDNKPVSL